MPVVTYREALNQALREEMQRDERVFLMGEEIGIFEGSYKVTAGLYKEFGPKRVRNTPIAEDSIVGLAIGAAMVGLRPVVEIMTINFSLLASDQIINNAAKIHYMFGGAVNVPLVVRTPGGSGQQLSCQHSQSLEVFYAHVPGLKVLAPATPADAKGLLKTAIREPDPVVFIEHLALYNTRGEIPEGEYTLPIGRSQVLRAGRDVTIVGHLRMSLVALDAAARLAEEGIEAEVVDLRSLRPLDTDTVAESVRKTNHCVIVEEDWLRYGVGAQVASEVYEKAFDDLDAPIYRLGGVETPMPYAKVLERAAIPTVDDVVWAVKRVLRR